MLRGRLMRKLTLQRSCRRVSIASSTRPDLGMARLLSGQYKKPTIRTGSSDPLGGEGAPARVGELPVTESKKSAMNMGQDHIRVNTNAVDLITSVKHDPGLHPLQVREKCPGSLICPRSGLRSPEHFHPRALDRPFSWVDATSFLAAIGPNVVDTNVLEEPFREDEKRYHAVEEYRIGHTAPLHFRNLPIGL